MYDTFTLPNYEDSNDSSMNSQSQSNGSAVEKNNLLLEIDPDAPNLVNTAKVDTPSPNDPFKQFSNLSSQQDHKTDTLLDFEGSHDNENQGEEERNVIQSNDLLSDLKQSTDNENQNDSTQSKELEEQLLLRQASQEFDNAAHELVEKLDLITSPPTAVESEKQPENSTQSKIEESQSTPTKKSNTASPAAAATSAKKPTPTTTRPSSATKPKTPTATSKSTEHKPAAAAAAATPGASASSTSKSTEHKPAAAAAKSTEPKPSTTTRKTLGPTATTSHKPKVSATSSNQESSSATPAAAAPKPTVNITIII